MSTPAGKRIANRVPIPSSAAVRIRARADRLRKLAEKEAQLTPYQRQQRDARNARRRSLRAYARSVGLQARAQQQAQRAQQVAATNKPVKPALALSPAETRAIASLPMSLRTIAKEIMLDPQMNEMGKLLMERASEFSNPMKAILAGIALHLPARVHFDKYLDKMWEAVPPSTAPEVIIGGGLHAAIYAAARVASGHRPPIVLEAKPRPGGAFACSVGPSFYLNSRNRPGQLTIPGDPLGALNFLPGAGFQPSDLGGREYQTNDELAWIIRLALAMYAKVYARITVTSVIAEGRNLVVNADRSNRFSPYFTGIRISAKRVIIATGLATPAPVLDSPRLLNFESLMARMDSPFPLRNMQRIAVLGAGDSGKTAIEALIGQGPSTRAIAALDWPQQIDWYGLAQSNRTEWDACQRSRYRNIGRVLPRSTAQPSRVRQKPAAAKIEAGFECIYVNDVPYDHVIDCRGLTKESSLAPNSVTNEFEVGGRVVCRKADANVVYVIGPIAGLAVRASESPILGNIADNAASIWRYAGRTAALAASLE